MGKKPEEQKEYACVLDSTVCIAKSLSEAWGNMQCTDRSSNFEEVDFYEVKRVRVEFEIKEIKMPVLAS